MPENPTGTDEPLDVRTIRHLVRLMKRYDLTAIDFIEGETKIRLRRRGPEPAAAPLPPAPRPPPPAPPAPPVGGARAPRGGLRAQERHPAPRRYADRCRDRKPHGRHLL